MTWLQIFFLLNALIGWVLFELAWRQTTEIRKVNEDRDSLFPAWRRYDAHKWRRWKMMPAAVTIMPLRFLALTILLLGAFVLTKFVSIGVNVFEGERLTGVRANLRDRIYSLNGVLSCFFTGINVTNLEADESIVNYEEYLGQGYEKLYKRPKGRVSTYVSNHVSAMDIFSLVGSLNCDLSFVAGGVDAPIAGFLIRALECIHAPRDGTPEAREAVVHQIEER